MRAAQRLECTRFRMAHDSLTRYNGATAIAITDCKLTPDLATSSDVRVSRSMPVFAYRGHIYTLLYTTYLHQIEYRGFLDA